jgi:hypothetical protein
MHRLAAYLIPIVFIAGCRGPNVVPVSGRVTLDGQPLTGVVVYFRPATDRSNPGAGSVGTTDSNGYYELRQIQPDRRGAVIGDHLVTIRTDPNDSDSKDPNRKALEEKLLKLATDLECTIPPGGKSDADFPLPLPPKP